MNRLNVSHILGFLILISSLILLLWSIYPLPVESRRLRIPGIGQLNLVWNKRIRMGDSVPLKLEFDSSELGIGGASANETETTNFEHIRQFSLDTADNILVETRVELPGVQIEPGEELIQPLRIGEKLFLNWYITPYESGELEGELWVYLKVLSEGREDVNRFPISILNFQTQVMGLFGMIGQTSRIFGIIGICFALIILRRIIGGYAGRFLHWSEKLSQ